MEIGVSSIEHRFLKLTHVNRFEIAEDFNMGDEISAFAGLSTPTLGGEEGTVWFWRLRARRGFEIGAEHFVTGGVAWTARHRHGEIENSLTSIRLDYVNKLSPRWPLVATARFHGGINLDPEVQITLGVDNGLRGYPVRQFVGTRAVLLSAEQRVFIADEVLQLVSFAAAAFVDTGFAWPEDRSVRLADLKSNVGLSLLLGRTRLSSTTPGVRFDLAYALDPISGRSRWLFSVGSKIEL
jgi:hemolysin activation/secretion protein